MKICGSILDLNPKTKEEIDLFSSCGIDSIHLDVMDGIFTPRVTFLYDEVKDIIKDKKMSIHFMVNDVKEYIEKYSNLNPEYIIFHLETSNILDNINLLKQKNIKVGISIKPNTDISLLVPYLDKIDLVLIMSVEPGYGGQSFIYNTYNRIDYLYEYRRQNNLNYLIEVDGGVNKENINLLIKCDMVVVGSFLTKGNYKEKFLELKEVIK